MKKKPILLLGLLLLLTVVLVNSSQAYEVTNYDVWLGRNQVGSSVTYGFYSDLWGTGIRNIIITTPSGQTYAMEYDAEEEQWMFDKEGGSEILSEFLDGTYTFAVEYTDSGHNQTLYAKLGGSFPPFPVCISLNRHRLTWEVWTNPVDPSGIEIEITSENDDEINANLPYTASSYDIPDGFIKNNTNYEIIIYFISKTPTNSGKLSTITKFLKITVKPMPWIPLLLLDE